MKTQNQNMDPFQRQQGLEAERQTEMMLKTFRGILNKLTPKKFEALMKRVDGLSINSENRLKAVIKLIVDKAVVDHSCSIYAEMCHHMKKVGFSVTMYSLSLWLVTFVPNYC